MSRSAYKVTCLIAWLLVIVLTLSSCRVWNPNRMFNTSADYGFKVLSDSMPTEIRLGSGDVVSVQILTNDGYTMLTPGLENPTGGFRNSSNSFEVDLSGYLRLPFIDTIDVDGLSIREAEQKVEHAFELFFREPFAQITVLNRRAFLFGGGGGGGGASGLGNGVVIPLASENPTLIEVLALAGGIPPTNKAYEIKLIRYNSENGYEIALVNLRDINDLNKTQIYIRHRDIIYIDPLVQTTFLTQAVALLGILTSLSSVVLLYLTLTR